jgi:hypothetical protein
MMGTAPSPQGLLPIEKLSSGVVMPIRAWPEILSLAVTEIREYGATSIQVVRRLRSLLQELGDLVVPERRPAVEEELRRLDETVASAFAGSVDLDRAGASDAQGIGGPAGIGDPGPGMSSGKGRDRV